MGSAKSALLATAIAVAGAVTAGSVVAEQGSGGDTIVAKVGDHVVTARALVFRLAAVPDFQLATLGSSPSEIKRQYLEQVVVRDELFAMGAEARKLDQTTRARERIDNALRTARVNLLHQNLDISPAEIAAFYAENKARFDAPERIAVTRILCATRGEAATVLAAARGPAGQQRWNDLAREHSTDKATSMRGGALGFVAEDGSSSEASVRVDPGIFAAARKVKDGELVAEPVPEGSGFAVIWRRGSTPAVHRTIEDETAGIRQVLARRKLGSEVKALVESLRAGQAIEEHPDLIDLIEVGPDGNIGQRKRPGVAKRRPPVGPAPSATPTGLR